MNDEATEKTGDLELADKAATEADGIATISQEAAAQAARDLVAAAAEARAREFLEDPQSSHRGPDENGVTQVYVLDSASGDYWRHESQDVWTNVRTGEVLGHDPSVPDEEQFAWVLDDFKYFYERWSTYPTVMAQCCESAKKRIQSGNMGSIANAQQVVAPGVWEGDSADAFRKYFLNPFVRDGGVVTNQQAVLDELAVAMSAYAAMLKQARLDAKSVAEACVDRLDAMRPYGSGGELKPLLSVAGVVVGVITTVVTAGTTTALTLGLIAQGIAAAGIFPGAEGSAESGHRLPIKGETVLEFMDGLRDFLTEFREGMDGVEAAIADAVSETVGQVEGWLSTVPEDVPDDQGAVNTILPYEPNGDKAANLTDGEKPGADDFRVPR